MTPTKTVMRLLTAFDDCDRVLAQLTPEQATSRMGGGSAFAWTLAHVTNSVDAWINVRFQGLSPHPLIGQSDFRFGGSGDAPDWQDVQAGIREVRAAARRFLEPLAEAALDHVVPYDGSITALHATGLCLRDAVDIDVIHHYFHIGEIAAKRGLLGHDLANIPTAFWEHPDWHAAQPAAMLTRLDT